MKYTITIICFLISLSSIKSQSKYDIELIKLSEVYRKYHFSNAPPKDVFKELKKIKSPELKKSRDFIKELIKTNNDITTRKFLTKPDSTTLKSLYIIRGLNWNMHEAEPKEEKFILDSLLMEHTDYYELLSCYYGMLFTSVGNKNRPFDMSTTNFKIDEYNLVDKTEKGIFFLESMETFGTMIWGYMNVPNPPNYKKAMSFINKYPQYNSELYYQYLNLNFKDFVLTIDKSKPKESFKTYYLNKYMNTILYHAMSFSRTNGTQEDVNAILLGSIIKNESYWKHSETPEIFENIFKKVKK